MRKKRPKPTLCWYKKQNKTKPNSKRPKHFGLVCKCVCECECEWNEMKWIFHLIVKNNQILYKWNENSKKKRRITRVLISSYIHKFDKRNKIQNHYHHHWDYLIHVTRARVMCMCVCECVCDQLKMVNYVFIGVSD